MDIDRAVLAMRVTYFHWGFHGWAVYVMVGLCLAYFGFRKKLPLTLRSALHPVIGDRIYGPIGHAVDLLAVFGTVFGVATSLGLGVSQMATGLNHLFKIDPGTTTQVILIAVISVIATFSAVSGVGKGIRIISEWNIWLSIVLLAYFLFGGPAKWLMGFFVTTVGDYLWNVIPMGFRTFNASGDAAWQGGWTIFYWGWWISWAPFVGMFIARISRGRTIREFMVGVMFVPTMIAFFWLCIFGGNALYLELNATGGPGTAGIAQLIRDWNLPSALYGTIDLVTDVAWLNWAMAFLATFLLATWFITSSDSGTLVITTMLSMGDDNPPQRFRIVWGLGEGIVAAVLLLAGGLKALQTASIAAALPVSVIMLLMTYGIIKSLNEDPSAVPSPKVSEAPDGTSLERELHA
jgi:choline/glycine/proline betaine transport protein